MKSTCFNDYSTSYSTAGTASNEIIVVGDFCKLKREEITSCIDNLTGTGEFDSVRRYDFKDWSTEVSNLLHGHVVLFLDPLSDFVDILHEIVVNDRSRIGFAIFSSSPEKDNQNQVLEVVVEQHGEEHLLIIFRNSNSPSDGAVKGSKEQPSVQSRQQFSYLWSTSSDAKERLLQKLAQMGSDDKAMWRQSQKFWDECIRKAIKRGHDDHQIYSYLREECTGASLTDSLVPSRSTNNMDAEVGDVNRVGVDLAKDRSSLFASSSWRRMPASSSEDPNAPTNARSDEKEVQDMDEDTSAVDGHHRDPENDHENEHEKDLDLDRALSETSDGADSRQAGGRVEFMVKMIKSCIPNFMFDKQEKKWKVRTLLDYGCAEGAITAHLCKHLGIAPEKGFGADVRRIPDKGFTYLPIPAETDVPPRLREMLSIEDGSMHLVTASMVFHHVRHIQG